MKENGEKRVIVDNGERYALMHYEGEWGKKSYCFPYSMGPENALYDNYHKHDLVVIVEMVCNNPKNEIKYKMSTTLEFGMKIFKPVFHIQYCIKSSKYESTSDDFSIIINPMPKVSKHLNLSQEEVKKLSKQAYEMFEV